MTKLKDLPTDLQQTAQGYRHFCENEDKFNMWVQDVMMRRETTYEDTVLACSKALKGYVIALEQEYGKQVAEDFTQYTGIDNFFSIGENT